MKIPKDSGQTEPHSFALIKVLLVTVVRGGELCSSRHMSARLPTPIILSQI